jgi:glycosyltransferase involved in cell wall biosynthesis
MQVSILLLTHNEAINLPRCLGALSWCDDIVVVDSGSTDRSAIIAAELGARVLTRSFDNFAAQRNFGLENGGLRNEWILHLDADEVVTPAFADAIARLAPPPHIYGWRVPFKVMFFGRWLRRAGMWPGYQVRMGHVSKLRFVQVGHGQREAVHESSLGTFPEALLHYSFSHGLEHWLRKHIKYAKDEANLIMTLDRDKPSPKWMLFSSDVTTRRRGAKAVALRLPLILRPAFRFIYVYILRRGFLDGMAGLAYAILLSIYEAMISILVFEIRAQIRLAK